ncbi:purine nucleoside permease [Aulographum hederae CBS 113979]|uniref:Purine nucleoside permease n=1 Tax=Aulographum hederae CBS 113979 TaxID=1176131 RepID=A0A6G1GVQ2_9PEZI|nr:purine nucleoside permease [Aulographum hederae CBS 113979]
MSPSFLWCLALLLLPFLLSTTISAAPLPHCLIKKQVNKITPKIFIVNHFNLESDAWYGIPDFDLLARNISIPGLSSMFPEAHCTVDGDICQVITGMGEINAAVSITNLLASPLFDLRKTYFLIAGIAGINPDIAPLGSITFARYAVQVGLQYEIDSRELPTSPSSKDFTTGYIPFGVTSPSQYPATIYGTEIFELNANLRHVAATFAAAANLSITAEAQAYSLKYASAAATAVTNPLIVECDVVTSDTWFSGALLAHAFANYTSLLTNGSGVYCTTAQEDNATLESLLRGAVAGTVDFGRIIVMRAGSDFDRPWEGQGVLENLFEGYAGFGSSVGNLVRVGREVIRGILGDWDGRFEGGVVAENYFGDIWGSLGGVPEFLPQMEEGDGLEKRRMMSKRGRANKGMPVMRL